MTTTSEPVCPNRISMIYSPFMGVGSEGVVAMAESRKFIGCELNPAYYRQAVKNIEEAEAAGSFGSLFGIAV
jgi:DNA modification methylase